MGKRKWGYDADQVDAFLDRAHALYESEDAQLTQQDIQNVSFDLSKGGYDITQVDAALARLEQAVVDKQTTREITEHGRVAWKAQTEELYRQVCEHADRDAGERFARGRDRKPSYDRKQVDRLIDQIVDKAAVGLGADGTDDKDARKLADVNSSFVSNIVFTQRKGKRGYDERQVDFYLNSCVQLLSRLESFARVADYVSGVHEPVPSRKPADGVTPLFGSDNAYAPMPAQNAHSDEALPQSFAPAKQTVAQSGESFHALHQAEEALFASPSAAGASLANAQAAGQPVSSLAALARSTGQAESQPADQPSAQQDAQSGKQTPAAGASVPAAAPAIPAPAPVQPAAAPSVSPAVQAAPAVPAPQPTPTAGAPVSDLPVAAPAQTAAPAVEPMPVSFAPAVKPRRMQQDEVKPGEATAAFDPLAALAEEESGAAAPVAAQPAQPIVQPAVQPPVQEPAVAAPAPAATEHSKSDVPGDLFSGLYFNPESKADFDIPDLSFPTLNVGETHDLFANAPADKTKSNESQDGGR
ncbi:DivIVA domain-containing protein [Bifidobacterium leontopitheci]